MKNKIKFVIPFILGIILFSCQQEDFDSGNVQGGATPAALKSTSIPSLTKQLVDKQIPFYIQSVNGEYLCIDKSGYPVTRAKGTGNEFIWNLETPTWGMAGYRMKNALGNGNNKYLGFVPLEGSKSKTPKMVKDAAYVPCNWHLGMVSNTNLYYYIQNSRAGFFGPDWDNINTYLTVLKNNNRSCQLNAKDNVSNQEWMISPVGEYIVNGLSYTLSSEDITTMQPTFVMNLPLESGPADMERTVVLTGSYVNESEFSETKGTSVVVKNSASLSFSIPKVVDFGTSTDMTTTETWSYTEREKRTVSISVQNSLKFNQPKNTIYRVMIVGSQYKMNATYIMNLTHVSKGYPLTVSGKWKGIQVYDLRVVVKDETTGAVKIDKALEDFK